MYTIDKEFSFCYGHRVHNQALELELSVDGKCKCRHLHGHNAILKIGLSAETLQRDMVTDFKNLECIKTLVDDVLDHKFICDFLDPLFFKLFPIQEQDIVWDDYNLGRVKEDVLSALTGEDYELLDGLVIVDFVPTSENLCAMFARIAQKRLDKILGDGVRVEFVDFWETPKSHCRFVPTPPIRAG